MQKTEDNLINDVCHFVEKKICEIVSRWSCSPSRTIEQQKNAIWEYYDLFTEEGKQYFNLQATPKSNPIETSSSWNRDVVLSRDRYKLYEEYQLKPHKNSIKKEGGKIYVTSTLHAKIDGWAFQSPVTHVIQKIQSKWRIIKTLEYDITPGHAAYDSVFCRWMLPYVGPIPHIGAVLARFTKYFVKMGLSSAIWQKQPNRRQEGEINPKFGIIAQELLTAYLFGALPINWIINPNSHEGRAEIDLKIIDERQNQYYLESKASANNMEYYKDKLTREEEDQINRLKLSDYKEFHVIKFGTKKHNVHLTQHKLSDGRNIDVTIWNVEFY